MGNTEGKFEGGHIIVSTDHDFYAPGSDVFGKIYIRTNKVVDAEKITLQATGVDKCSFWRGSDKNRHKVEYERNIFDFKGDCFTFTNALTQGDFCVGFQFTLPLNLPSSCYFKDESHSDNPKGKVRYTLTARLHIRGTKDVIKTDHWLFIQEPPVPFKQNAEMVSKGEAKSCCCSSGTTTVKSTFDKNVFFSSEKSTATIEIDNSNSGLPIKAVNYMIYQRVFLHGVDKENGCCQEAEEFTYEPFKATYNDSIPSGASSKGPFQLSLDFSQIKFNVSEYKEVSTGLLSSKQVKRSPAEIFQLSHLPAPCHSTHVTNDYYLKVQIEYDACDCCNENPHVMIPMTLIPLSYKNHIEQPAGFSPVELGYFKFKLQAPGFHTPQNPLPHQGGFPQQVPTSQPPIQQMSGLGVPPPMQSPRHPPMGNPGMQPMGQPMMQQPPVGQVHPMNTVNVAPGFPYDQQQPGVIEMVVQGAPQASGTVVGPPRPKNKEEEDNVD